MKIVSVLFNAHVSKRIGADGMGLFSLIMSAYLFAVTLSTSGISLACMRLVSEELGAGNGRNAVKAVKKCLIYAISFGCTSALLLFSFSNAIAEKILCEPRCALSLRALSVSLPFIAISNVLGSYFSAVRRVYKSAAVNVFEQFVKIFITLSMLDILAPKGIEDACLALVIGTSVSEGLSFSYLFVLYIIDKRRHLPRTDAKKTEPLTKRMLGISLPIAFSQYLRSGLSTINHVLIPRGLKLHGADSSSALSVYGTIHGMVFPLILFPSALCATFSSLIVPELSELAQKYGSTKGNHIKYIAKRSLRLGMLFSVFTAGIMITFANEFGTLLYKSAEASRYIRIFAILIPVMYIDTFVDGMLKGLGQQLASLRYNIIDSGTSIVLVLLLLPKYGADGYIFCVFATEILNTTLSLSRLIKTTGIRFNFLGNAAIPALSAVGASAISVLVSSALADGNLGRILIGIAAFTVFYVIFSDVFGYVKKDDKSWLKKIFTS